MQSMVFGDQYATPRSFPMSYLFGIVTLGAFENPELYTRLIP